MGSINQALSRRDQIDLRLDHGQEESKRLANTAGSLGLGDGLSSPLRGWTNLFFTCSDRDYQ